MLCVPFKRCTSHCLFEKEEIERKKKREKIESHTPLRSVTYGGQSDIRGRLHERNVRRPTRRRRSIWFENNGRAPHPSLPTLQLDPLTGSSWFLFFFYPSSAPLCFICNERRSRAPFLFGKKNVRRIRSREACARQITSRCKRGPAEKIIPKSPPPPVRENDILIRSVCKLSERTREKRWVGGGGGKTRGEIRWETVIRVIRRWK